MQRPEAPKVTRKNLYLSMFRIIHGLRQIQRVRGIGRTSGSWGVLLLQPIQVSLRRNLQISRRALAQLKLESPPKLSDVERLVEDVELRLEFLNTISSSKSNASLHSIFINAIDMASGDRLSDAYTLVLGIWRVVFSNSFQHTEVQVKLLESKLKVIHLMMNRGDYNAYLILIQPIYANRRLNAQTSWADTLMSTLKLSQDGEQLSYSRLSIMAFLNGNLSLEDKRLLLSVFVKKTLLYSNDVQAALPGVLEDFLEFLAVIGDDHLSLSTTEYLVYEKALRLIATQQSSIPIIERVVMSVIGDMHLLSSFMSSLISAVSFSLPIAAVNLWKFKKEAMGEDDSFCTSDDLTNVMWAMYHVRAYDQIFQIHEANPQLHHDKQIEIMLKANEKTKNWGRLQKQFEDMYGHNDLPHTIHYTIVMNALASMGVWKEVDQLYYQLRARNLRPNAPIFSALIKSNITRGNKEEAVKWYDTFLKEVDNGVIDPSEVAALLTQMLVADFVGSNIGDTLQVFEKIIEAQLNSKLRFVSSQLVVKMLEYVSSVYRKLEFDRILAMARKLELLDEKVYCRAIKSLTHFEQFEQAEELAFEAHLESKVPFSSALVTAAQLRNFRIWRRSTTNKSSREFLKSRIINIIRRVDEDIISPRNLSVLLAEIIRFLLESGQHQPATDYLRRARALNNLQEDHYIPFLKFYSLQDTYDGYSNVLASYRQMAEVRVSLSSRTYLYLIRALLHMDHVNHTGFANSRKLLDSVFNIYGFAPQSDDPINNVVHLELVQNAPTLLKIVADYTVATGTRSSEDMDLILRFLNYIKEKLGTNIPFDLRIAVLHQMGRIYLSRSEFVTASKLISNAMDELHDVVDKDPEVISKQLHREYRRLVAVKLQIMKLEGKNDLEELNSIIKNTLQRNIRLSGDQYNDICTTVLDSSPDIDSLRLILDVCQRYLVSANWLEVSIRRKMQYIYRLFLAYMMRQMPFETIQDHYAILHKYYNIGDVRKVDQEFLHVQSPTIAIETELEEFGELSRSIWNVDEFLDRPIEFFVPERWITSLNIISPTLGSKLAACIEELCDGDKTVAFKLYDLYPEVMEYILYYIEERQRITAFREEVDQHVPPPNRANEERSSRRDRSIEALEMLCGKSLAT